MVAVCLASERVGFCYLILARTRLDDDNNVIPDARLFQFLLFVLVLGVSYLPVIARLSRTEFPASSWVRLWQRRRVHVDRSSSYHTESAMIISMLHLSLTGTLPNNAQEDVRNICCAGLVGRYIRPNDRTAAKNYSDWSGLRLSSGVILYLAESSIGPFRSPELHLWRLLTCNYPRSFEVTW